MLCSKSVALVTAAILGLVGAAFAFVTAGDRYDSGPAMSGGTDSIGDTLSSFRAPAYWPTGLAWDGNDLWMADNEEDSLYRLSREGVVLAAFALPDSMNSPAGMTFIGSRLWAVDENTARLYVLDPATGQTLRTFLLPDTSHPDPTSWGVAWDGTRLWHSQYAWGRIFQLDTTDGSVLSSFAPPDSWIMGIAYDGQYLWGVSTRGTAYVMSLPSGAVVNSYPWKVPYPLGLALVNDYMWNASGKPPSGTRRIYRVDVGLAGLVESPGNAPSRRLACTVPNPFRTRISISTVPGSPAIVGCRVFDAQGSLVRCLASDHGAVTWDGTDQAGRRAAAGAYAVSVRFADGLTEQLPVRLSR